MLDAGCLLGYNPVCFLGYNAGTWMLAWYNGRRGFHSGASVNSVYVFSSFPFSTSSREARPGPGVHKPEGLAIRMASAWGILSWVVDTIQWRAHQHLVALQHLVHLAHQHLLYLAHQHLLQG